MKNNITLSVIIPAYNEADRIGATFRSLETYFKGKEFSYEIIVVDDGSIDGTASIVRAFAETTPAIKLLENGTNQGKGYSVNRGMLSARGAYRLFMDADNSVDISHLDTFWEWIKNGYDVVIGSIRIKDSHIVEHSGRHRRFLGNLSKTLIRTVAVPGIHDTQRGFKFFSADTAKRIFPKQTIWRFGFDIEILVIAWLNGFKIKELPVMWNNPAGSKVTLMSYFETLRELVWITRNRLARKYSVENVAQGVPPPYVQTTRMWRTNLKQRIRTISRTMNTSVNRESFAESRRAVAEFIVGSEHKEKLVHIMDEDGKRKGFSHKGKEFVHHGDLHHRETAFRNLVRHQKFFIVTALTLLVGSFVLNWYATLIGIFGVLTFLYFLDLLFNAYMLYRTFRVRPEIIVSKRELALAEGLVWPMYTIFCPLYKEWEVVPQFVAAMQKLDYPHDKLQVMFLLEENDQETVEKIRAADLPAHFEIVVVPHSNPKTKPKAMNYGLKKARGEYVVIYDAEDVPEPDQLKKAVLAFAKIDRTVACVQAKLNFYNPKQNILTRVFTAEYSLWFDLVLPGLQSISAPIPLGGTSNHFRVSVLRSLGGWDAFNVTEDCDLGMRLSRRGLKTAIIESTTYEEANSHLINWYNQRSRWIKGYMQTYFVHMRSPRALYREGKLRDLLFFQLIVGGKVVSLFINPLMWIITITYFTFRAQTGVFIESFFPGPILYIGVFSLIFGNFLYLYYYMVGCARREYHGITKYIFLVPLYWLGMSLAAWRAAYEVVVKPHYWAKTQHGLHLSKEARAKASVAAPTKEAPVESVPKKRKPYNMEFFGRALRSGAMMLVLSSIVANILNFVFNAYLGRQLTLEEFGIVTMMSTFAYMLSLFTGALGTTMTHVTSFLEGAYPSASRRFFRKKWLSICIVAALSSTVWLISVPVIANFFQVTSFIVIIAFAPAIIFGALDSFNRGYLQGTFNFRFAAIVTLGEVIAKLAIVFAFVTYGFHEFAALAIPLSVVVAWVFSTTIAVFLYRRASSVISGRPIEPIAKKFPLGFYGASLMTGISVVAFLSVDVILAKHYLSPDDAGRYAMLSLVGKMIYFFGALLNGFIVTFVSRSEGEGTNPEKPFKKIFMGTAFLAISAGLGLALLGSFLVPFLLGENARSIVAFVPSYALAMTLFTLTTSIVLYRLARKHYIFPAISLSVAMVMMWGIVGSHASIDAFVKVILNINILYFAAVATLHLFSDVFIRIYWNVRDILAVFKKLPAAEPLPEHMRILIFNWSDSENVFAGGAETYIHALAKRWVESGHSVTLFCSNDRKQDPHGNIDGIRIIRRGGFYGLYAVAAVYYLLKFRGKFDVIVDCENGIPFFTPLYAKEPVYCLVHHIHQDVFRKSLILPLALFASFLEKRLMPLVYRGSNFITVSESSKREMKELNVTEKEITVVYPGVDLKFLSPGMKSKTPLVSYVGRLKEYKSVDVLLRAFVKILVTFPEARLIVAGDGDELGALKRLAAKLNISVHVSFRGKVSEEEKRDIMRSSWVVVNPSMMEGWGLTTIEANACGTPVVASDVPGLRDSVRDGETGILVPYGDAHVLAREITRLLEDPVLRVVLAAKAVAWAANFEWQKSSDAFLRLLSRSVGSVLNYKASLADRV
ncbi:MAG: Glycosyltransferase, group 2 family protein [Parcubacteria group bacterium GW2011_GWA1_47_8]|nr:MAG: Glycosyltransferase, group 2 family protein [Parcubacteria group bacterium GW2011_GWA1_47_8]